MLPIRRALAILDEIGARAVDLTPAVAAAPPDEMFFRFDGHLTPPANRRVADAILERFDLRCDAVGSAEPES